jgi:hypothetical protein
MKQREYELTGYNNILYQGTDVVYLILRGKWSTLVLWMGVVTQHTTACVVCKSLT